MPLDETLKITSEIEAMARRVARVALQFEALVERKLGISGTVGEILVAKEFGLRLVRSDIEQGYDALDKSRRQVQIKVRRSEGSKGRSLPSANSPTSRFSTHLYDYALLAILTREYDLYEVHKASRRQIEAALTGKPRRVLSIGKFKRIGRQVYPRVSGMPGGRPERE